MFSISDYHERVAQLTHSYELAEATVQQEQAALKQAKKQLKSLQLAVEKAQIVAEEMQSIAHARIVSLVSQALAAVFGEEAYELKILFEKRRNQTEARLLFERQGQTCEPLSAAGGGAVDVAAFALRIAAICLSKPQCRRLLVLDEPFRFVSKEYWPALQEMILTMAEKLDVQFIIVTHLKELELGKVIEIGVR